MRWFKYITIIAAILLFGSGIGICLWMAGTKSVTSNESVFLGVFVSLLSILASWLVSHIYAELSVKAAREDARDNLRMYALKAAEKVTNLSNELGKLAVYLQDELDESSYANPESDLQGKNERIQSAIHLLHTLKSVNDGSLSDWEGVIGDELKSQREQEEEREEDLAELVERVDHLSAAIDGHDGREELENLRREIRNIAAMFGGRTILPPTKPRRAKQEVSMPCPSCEATLNYKQRAKANSFKVVECSTCKGKFVSHYDTSKSSFLLEARRLVDEQIACPYCGKLSGVPMDNMPGTAVTVPCPTCGLRIRISRDAAHGIRAAKLVNEVRKLPAQTLTEEILASVKKNLPPQPWPTNIHRQVAAELNVNEATVANAITELIQRGECRHQFNGRLFIEVPPPSDSAN